MNRSHSHPLTAVSLLCVSWLAIACSDDDAANAQADGANDKNATATQADSEAGGSASSHEAGQGAQSAGGSAAPRSGTGKRSAATRQAPAEYPSDWNVQYVDAKALPEDFQFGHEKKTLAAGTTYGMQTLALPCDVAWERDIPVRLRDGTEIFVDVLSPPDAKAPLPVLVAWSPYGKSLPTAGPMSVPPEWFSGIGKFEGPDAAYWVCHGYAIVDVDVRGAYKSAGKLHSFGMVDAADGYDAIEWIAAQPWSNGHVGMHGASWLSIAEWFIAATRPPHLKAIAPWNGQSDLYRNSLAQGGIPDTAFSSRVGSILVGVNGLESTVGMLESHPLVDDYWIDKRAKVEDIEAPAYVGADIATALHTAGTLDAFRRLGSREKWLRVNTTNEWHDQYTPENLEDLRRFFDHYLKEEANDWTETPKVRVSIMDPGKAGQPKTNVPYDSWPLPDTEYRKLYLDADAHTLTKDAPEQAARASYDAEKGQVTFNLRFDQDTQIVGHAVARLYVEAESADDLDLFVLIEKLDSEGTPLVPSELAAMYFPMPPPGVPGRLRASMRELDLDKSTDFLPVHAFRTPKKLGKGEVVQLDIALMPTALRWHKGEQLQLTVAGSYVKGPGLPLPTLNHGTHIVHTGKDHASYLQLPIVPWTR